MGSSTKTRAKREQFVVDRKGKRKGVILPMAEYERLLEDLHDLAVVAERRKEKSIRMEELKNRLLQNERL